MNRQPPVHYRQPRAPQAVPAREAKYATGFAAGAVLVVVCLLLFGLVMAAMTSTTAFAVLLFVVGLLGATMIGLWAVGR